MKTYLMLLTLAAMVFGSAARAADLLQVFRDAMANDAVFAAARASLEAGRERLPQGRALTLPSISASAGLNNSYNDISQRNGGNVVAVNRDFRTWNWALTLTQPLYRPQNDIQYEQAGFQVSQAEAAFGQATQDLVVRTAQAYFDVLASQDNLTFIQAQKTAIAEQLAQARRNFEVGTATITDTNEAQARFDLSLSQEIAAQNDLEIKRRTLQQIIGRFPDKLSPLRRNFDLSPPQPARMDDWVDSAQRQNFAVRIQEAAVQVAEREIQRNRAGHRPTVDLVGSLGQNDSTGNATTGVSSNSRATSLGLQLTLPIYQGGAVDSRVREAIANRDKARSDLENARRQAALSARQSYLGVTNGLAQVRALEQAERSSEIALASNRLGYEVGVRINIDVLNAQQQLFSTKRDLARARYDTIVNGLKLKAAAGTLSDADVEDVNRLLGAD